MGIDGAGKTTLAKAIKRAVAAAGVEVVEATWDGVVGSGSLGAGYPRSTVEHIGVECWRLMYAGAEAAGVDAPRHTGSAYDMIPALFADGGAAGIKHHVPSNPIGVRQSGPVISTLLEFAGVHLVQAEVVLPALRRGAFVICDSFGLRNAIKVLRLAQRMPEPSVSTDTVDRLLGLLTRGYADPHLQPDIGLFLDADPATAHRWRMDQNGRLGPAEDLNLTGVACRSSYVEFQSVVGLECRAVAEQWGWHVLPVDGRPAEETARQALEIIRRHDSATAGDRELTGISGELNGEAGPRCGRRHW
jgi:thymidylate kinase